MFTDGHPALHAADAILHAIGFTATLGDSQHKAAQFNVPNFRVTLSWWHRGIDKSLVDFRLQNICHCQFPSQSQIVTGTNILTLSAQKGRSLIPFSAYFVTNLLPSGKNTEASRSNPILQNSNLTMS
jgi:hypothetical protein